MGHWPYLDDNNYWYDDNGHKYTPTIRLGISGHTGKIPYNGISGNSEEGQKAQAKQDIPGVDIPLWDTEYDVEPITHDNHMQKLYKKQ